MVRVLLFVVVIAALAGIVLSLLRRTPKTPVDRSAEATGIQPALPAPKAAHALGREAARHKLHELSFGAALASSVPAEHVKVVSAVAGVLHAAATDPKYAPRRPMLLPQLLRAVNDSDTTRKELALLIAHDPALVGSLLKLANSPIYRRGSQPVEGVERALAVLGTQGVRSLAAAALMQPVFRAAAGDAEKFPEVVWEHTYRSAAAAELHATSVENADPFAAQLLALVMGLATIVVYRVALDQYAGRRLTPDPAALASLLDEHTGGVARRIAASWELSASMLEALDDQRPENVAWPQTALGRSLRFGLTAGALSMLRTAELIDDDTGLVSLAAAGGEGQRFERLWERLTWPEPERVPS
ncbi:MAG TPA: HDOD domain-containing protein [Gammaproteobacteria bacterium]|nr:HDOD domain-containing protein [Gammaproteobacteria bacterium]